MSQFSLRLVRHAAVLLHSHVLFFPTVSHALRTPPSLSYPSPTLATHYPHPFPTLFLPSPLSPDHPPLVSIQGHGEQLLSIPVAGTSRIDSCYLFSLHPGYECCPRTPRHLFRLLPGFESTCHLACASRHSASFVTSTPDSVLSRGKVAVTRPPCRSIPLLGDPSALNVASGRCSSPRGLVV